MKEIKIDYKIRYDNSNIDIGNKYINKENLWCPIDKKPDVKFIGTDNIMEVIDIDDKFCYFKLKDGIICKTSFLGLKLTQGKVVKYDKK